MTDTNTKPNTEVKTEKQQFTQKEIDDGKAMAIIAYIIALIPYFAEKNNKYVRFHAVQGMNILLVAVAWAIVYWIITSILTAALVGNCRVSIYGYTTVSGCAANYTTLSVITGALSLVSIAIGIISIIGIVNAASGKAKEVPLLGKVKIIKK